MELKLKKHVSVELASKLHLAYSTVHDHDIREMGGQRTIIEKHMRWLATIIILFRVVNRQSSVGICSRSRDDTLP